MAAVDVGDPVVARQPLVDERVVRGQQDRRRSGRRGSDPRTAARSRAGRRRAGCRRIPGTARHPAPRPADCAGAATARRSCSRARLERGSPSIRRTCRSRTAGSSSCRRSATANSSSSGMLLHRKNDSRDASSRSLSRYAPLALASAGRIAFNPEEKLRIDRAHARGRPGCRPRSRRAGPTRRTRGASDVLVGHRPPIGAARQRAQDLSRAASFSV